MEKVYSNFVKWAGGKGQLLNELQTRFPVGLGSSINKYAEPFVGGGALLFHVLNNYNFKQVYISDINKELIQTYIQIRDDVNSLIDRLLVIQDEYLSLTEDQKKNYYYKKREKYNILKGENKLGLESSALFIFLNRTCFNGLYRVNSKGEFNVPMGRYTNPKICDETTLKADSQALQNAQIVCGDYQCSELFIDEHTFTYFDPPYRPLNNTSSFTSYYEDRFNDEDQKELALFIKKLSGKGAKILLSNSDPKNTNIEDNFFDDIYSGFKIERVLATRNINSKGTKRGKITELIVSN